MQCGGSPSDTKNGAPLKRRLDKQQVSVLANETLLNEKEVKALYARFRRVTHPESAMTFQQFRNTMGIIGESSGQWLPEAMFRAFCDGDKQLNYEKYIRSLAIMLRGSEDQKLELSFKMATMGSISGTEEKEDEERIRDSDKYITLSEFDNLIRATDLLHRSLVSHPVAEISRERIAHLFEELASKSTVIPQAVGGEETKVITLEDYKNAARTNQEFLEMLGFRTNLRQRPPSINRISIGSFPSQTPQVGGHHSPSSVIVGSSPTRNFPQSPGMVDRGDTIQERNTAMHNQLGAQNANLKKQIHEMRSALKTLQTDYRKKIQSGQECKSGKQEYWWTPNNGETPSSPSSPNPTPSEQPPDEQPPSEPGKISLPKGANGSPSLDDEAMRLLVDSRIQDILDTFKLEEGDGNYKSESDGVSTPRSPNKGRDKNVNPSMQQGDSMQGMDLLRRPSRARSADSLVVSKPVGPNLVKNNSKIDVTKSKKKKNQQKVHRLLGPKKGLAVHFGHENWNMVLNMMVGIRIAVGRIQNEPRRDFVRFDFTNKEKFSIVPRLGNILDSIAGNKIQCTRFVDYSAFVFRKIRELNGIDSDDYLRSVGPEQLLGNMILGNLSSLSELSSEGKSGAFFYYTADGNFMIKTVTRDEKDLLRSMLEDYWEHMSNNPNTLLIHFYGLHSLRVKKHQQSVSGSTYQKLYFVVMGNIFKSHLEVHRRYDLKGSRLGRTTPELQLLDPTVARKDNDFTDDIGKGMLKSIRMGDNYRLLLLDQIERDSKFLTDRNIIDFSLLLGVHEFEPNGRDEYLIDLEDGSVGDVNSPTNAAASRALVNDDLQDEVLRGWRTKRDFVHGILSEPDLRAAQADASVSPGGSAIKHEGHVYFVGIIDILTYYGGKKKVEHNFKKMRYPAQRSEISCCPPDMYHNRFVKFMKEEVFYPQGSAAQAQE